MKALLIGIVLAAAVCLSVPARADGAATLERLDLQGSGEAVTTRAGGATQVTPFHVSSTRVRFEMAPYIGITDFRARKSFLLHPQKKVYVELPFSDDDSSMEIYTGDPCRESSELQELGGRCRRVGSQTLNGRKVEKWLVTVAGMEDEPFMTLYLDAKYGFVVRKESEDGVEEIRNFKEGPQPARLFELPRGYREVPLESLAASE